MPQFEASRPVLAAGLWLALGSCNDATDPEIQRVIGRSLLDSAEVTVTLRP